MNPFGPHVPSFGPSNAKIVLLGEHPGSDESEKLKPFVGVSGWELKRMLNTIGVNIDDCYRANVFSRQPSGNNLALYGTTEPSPRSKALGPLTTNPITYLGDEHFADLERLMVELGRCQPNIIIALGNIACWALLGQQGITNLRGTVYTTRIGSRDIKVLPTYHPAAILRQWEWRVIALADLEKAHVESDSPDLHFDNTELWLAPSLADIREFDALHMAPASICAADIETKRGQITCISFAPDPSISLTIPFWIEGAQPSYWPTVEEETEAWGYVEKWLGREDLVKVFQNGLYDIQYIAAYGLQPVNFSEDTMLMHHSLYSEMKKSLGFLGSTYTNVPAWKSMRAVARDEALKRDE